MRRTPAPTDDFVGTSPDFADPLPITLDQAVAAAPVQEAPNDGQQYARKDGGWALVTGGGGSTGLLDCGGASIPAGTIPVFNCGGSN